MDLLVNYGNVSYFLSRKSLFPTYSILQYFLNCVRKNPWKSSYHVIFHCPDLGFATSPGARIIFQKILNSPTLKEWQILILPLLTDYSNLCVFTLKYFSLFYK